MSTTINVSIGTVTGEALPFEIQNGRPSIVEVLQHPGTAAVLGLPVNTSESVAGHIGGVERIDSVSLNGRVADNLDSTFVREGDSLEISTKSEGGC